MIFYLVRHGQTDWNKQRRMQGLADIPLNEAGIKQMEELADKIAAKGLTFDRMIASPLMRARKSAEIIAERTGFADDIIFDKDFVERSCGALEGEVWTPELDMDDPKYGVEQMPDVCKRAERAIGKYTFSPDEKVMIVSHGALLMALRRVLSDYRIDAFDSAYPVIQGNVMCCEINAGEETKIYNVF